MNFFGLFYISDWLLIPVLLGCAFYVFLTWRYNELRDLGIPGPKPSVPLGTLGEIFKVGLTDIDAVNVKKYGKIYGDYICRDPQITIADVEIMKNILIKDFDHFTDRKPFYMRGVVSHGLFDTNGPRWRTMRRKLTPAFTSGKLKLMFDLTKKCCNLFMEHLDELAKSGEMFEAKEKTDALTSDNIASTSFGIELNAIRNPDHPFIVKGKKLNDMSIKNIFLLVAIFMPYVAKYLETFIKSCYPKDLEGYFIDLLKEAIQARQDNPTARKDLIQIILDAEKDSKKMDAETKAIFEQGLGFSDTDKGALTREEVIGNLILFLLAGYETTSGSLSFVLYNLAIHPDVQEQLAQEIEDEIGDQEVTYDMTNKLPYMEKVINETMRMYPLAAKVDRVCLSERQYGDLKIPKGMIIGIPIRYFHYDPDIWPEPEKFDPERFSPEEKAKRDPFPFMPFGHGPRMCIGNRFALLTLKTSLIHIIRQFRMLKCDKTEVPLKMKKDAPFFLQPENGIWLKVERR